MRDYTGTNPKFKITDELITPSAVKEKRFAPRTGSFYSGSVSIKTLTGVPFSNFVFKGVDVAVQLHTDPKASPVYMYLEFPDGVNEDLLLSYQAVDLSNDPQTDALNDLLDSLATVEGVYYEEDILNRPAALAVSPHKHRLSEDTSARVSSAILGLFNKSPEDITADNAVVLSDYLTKMSENLDTDEKEIVLAINSLVRVYRNVATKAQSLLQQNPDGLNTVTKEYVPALNEVTTAINVAASASDTQFDFYGYIFEDSNLTRLMTGGSKVWLIKSRVTITGLFSDDAGAKLLEAGDTVYYDSVSERLVYAPLGLKLAAKQDLVDESLIGPDKDVVSVINSQYAAGAILLGDNSPTLLGFISKATNFTTAPQTNVGYFVVTNNAVTITAPYADGSSYKVLNTGDTLSYSADTGYSVGVLSSIPLKVQSSVDKALATTDKTLVGSINELFTLLNAATAVDILAFKGYLSNSVVLPKPSLSSLWVVNASIVVTAAFGNANSKSLDIGSVVVYDKDTDLFVSHSLNVTGKQLLIDARLTTTSKNIIEAINTVHLDILNVSGDSSNNFQGYINADVDISSMCVGVVNKEWVVSVADVVVTAPYTDGVNVKVLDIGDVIRYRSGVISLDTIDNYRIGYAKAVEPGLNTIDKRADKILANYLIDGVGSGYSTGDIFETHRSPKPNEAIPLGSAPVSRLSYPKLFSLLGYSFGGDGDLLFGIPPKGVPKLTQPYLINNAGMGFNTFIDNMNALVTREGAFTEVAGITAAPASAAYAAPNSVYMVSFTLRKSSDRYNLSFGFLDKDGSILMLFRNTLVDMQRDFKKVWSHYCLITNRVIVTSIDTTGAVTASGRSFLNVNSAGYSSKGSLAHPFAVEALNGLPGKPYNYIGVKYNNGYGGEISLVIEAIGADDLTQEPVPWKVKNLGNLGEVVGFTLDNTTGFAIILTKTVGGDGVGLYKVATTLDSSAVELTPTTPIIGVAENLYRDTKGRIHIYVSHADGDKIYTLAAYDDTGITLVPVDLQTPSGYLLSGNKTFSIEDKTIQRWAKNPTTNTYGLTTEGVTKVTEVGVYTGYTCPGDSPIVMREASHIDPSVVVYLTMDNKYHIKFGDGTWLTVFVSNAGTYPSTVPKFSFAFGMVSGVHTLLVAYRSSNYSTYYGHSSQEVNLSTKVVKPFGLGSGLACVVIPQADTYKPYIVLSLADGSALSQYYFNGAASGITASYNNAIHGYITKEAFCSTTNADEILTVLEPNWNVATFSYELTLIILKRTGTSSVSHTQLFKIPGMNASKLIRDGVSGLYYLSTRPDLSSTAMQIWEINLVKQTFKKVADINSFESLWWLDGGKIYWAEPNFQDGTSVIKYHHTPRKPVQYIKA